MRFGRSDVSNPIRSAERTNLKVTSVYRSRFVIQVEKIEKERNNGQSVKLVSVLLLCVGLLG